MTRMQYLKRLLSSLPEMSAESGFPVWRLAASYAVCYILYGANSEEFRAMRLYMFNNRRRRQYLLYRASSRFARQLNAGMTAEDFASLNDKHRFNAAFRDLIRRDWLYIPDSTPDDIRAFLGRNGDFLIKYCLTSHGDKIRKFNARELDPEAFIKEWGGQPCLMEAFITQHPAMAALNPSTVNTVRLQTARKGDRVLLLGGCLRCGGADAIVDNFHQGGVAYPLDIKTGIVNGMGRTLPGDVVYVRHPSTGHVMPGFQIPHWDRLTEMAVKAALNVPHVGYVGWDIAVTADGPEFVEANVNDPDPIVFQLDDRGVRQTLADFVNS